MSQPIEAVVLDHVAHAVHRWQDVWSRYAVDLGAAWNSGGPGVGFAPGQLRFANQARVELLMPHDTASNDFLERFLRASGPGPHHLTFKVGDIRDAVERARRSGWEPIGIDLSDPEWMEAFLHPKQATGVVVQLAEASGPGWRSPAPADFPTDRRVRADRSGPIAASSLLRVTHAVRDMATARRLFGGLLGGRTVAEGTANGLVWADLSWGGPLDLRLVAPYGPDAPGSLAAWLGDRPGRVHHLALRTEEPDRVPDARPLDRGGPHSALGFGTEPGWVVPPEANAGLRLVLGDQSRPS